MTDQKTENNQAPTGPPDHSDYQEHMHSVIESSPTAAYNLHDEPSQNHRPRKHPHLKRNLFIAAFLLANIAMIGTSLALLSNKKQQPAQQKKQSTNIVAKEPSQTPPAASTSPASSKHYVSKPLSMEFDYPSDWHISSDSGNKSIKIASPSTDILDDTGRSVNSKVEIDVVLKYPDYPNELVNDSSMIVEPSEPIKYEKPTSTQRKQTNISFARFEGPDSSILSMFISGNLVYSKDQMVKSKNYQSIHPFITIHINSCSEDPSCSGIGVSWITIDTYHNNLMLRQAAKIIKSMRFN
jgi:hypothetical protein